MTDWSKYHEAPKYVVGMLKADAILYLKMNDCQPFAISKEDNIRHIIPAMVQILLNIEDDVVIGSALDGTRYGKW